ncbi:DNA repair protein RadA [Wenxinia saemankumensis]|uniref:DNA repair protein RadA n=1 Tax=Wenxinia saemankumensis TaxID=1447782 RepID=A0A1M6CND0_9RHOB|nr:DNA repair protein RadA [Wenxinia saemankumensis]SHI62459.1 DNA repair protein RadA/Sms [Wenxinia saemankumensis]
MPRDSLFVCQNCGATHPRWSGRCDACGEWNTIREEAPVSEGPGKRPTRGRGIDLTDLASSDPEPPRTNAGVEELDRVLGGGLVQASAILVGGDPGIGKSTLLLQASARFARQGLKVVYISGEESRGQVQMRARRLGLTESPVKLAAATNLSDILATLEAETPDLAVIDSIQTMWSDQSDSAPGSVSQVRAAAHELTSFAKRRGMAVVMVGHVTKEGAIAGPRVVEHMVDCVLYFEGDRGGAFRILRAHKNRFGPADEIGVFEMTGKGLVEVRNPSALFLEGRGTPAPGSAVYPGIEGTRPILTEIQALVAPAPPGGARRSVTGLDSSRLSMILAVLDARAGLSFAGLDVYLNVAGGLRIQDPAADLAIAAALVSAREGEALPADCVIFGEISLSGALRSVPQTENRLKEAVKLGFSSALLPPRPRRAGGGAGLELKELDDVPTFVSRTFTLPGGSGPASEKD